MGFAYSFMNSKSLVNCFVWNHQYFEKLEKPNIFVNCDAPENFTIGLYT